MVRLDDAQRRLVHGALVEAHGEEVGDLMMAQFAVDWSDLATKGDLVHHREMTDAALGHHRAVLEARIDAAVGGLRGEIGELRGEIGEFRGEVRGEIGELRGEIKDAMSKQTRMFVAWNAALLLGVGATALDAAQLLS